VFLHELNDAATVIAQLEVECAITIPKLLGAAAKLMERVQSTQGMSYTRMSGFPRACIHAHGNNF
jgi:hypothetical protein